MKMHKALLLGALTFISFSAAAFDPATSTFTDYTEQVAIPSMCSYEDRIDEDCAVQVQSDMITFHKMGSTMKIATIDITSPLVMGLIIAQSTVGAEMGEDMRDYDLYLGRAFEKGYKGL